MLVREVPESDDFLNTYLYETIVELYDNESECLTEQDVKDWVIGNKENFQLMKFCIKMCYVILYNNYVIMKYNTKSLLYKKILTVQHSTAIMVINTCLQWAVENYVKSKNIMVLKRLQEQKKVKNSLERKKQNKNMFIQ